MPTAIGGVVTADSSVVPPVPASIQPPFSKPKYRVRRVCKTSEQICAGYETYRSGLFRTVDSVNRVEIRPTVQLI